MNMIYNVEDRPRFMSNLVFAVQQLLAIIAATLLVPTLVNASQDTIVMDQAAALQGCSLTEEQWRSVIGQSLAATQTALRSWFGQRIDPQRFVDDWCRLMLERVRKDGMPLMPGAREALEMLRRRGVATALVTSNGQAVVREYLAISGFAPYFDQVITGEMTQRSKPAPDIYLLGAKLLGLSPAECAGVEDSVNGVKAIRAAGMLCVMVPDVAPYGPELSPYVDVCLGSLHELEQAIFGKE